MNTTLAARPACWLLFAALCVLVNTAAAAQDSAGSKVLSRAAFELPAFEQLPKAPFGAVSAAAYARIKKISDGRLERITYSSQGHKVTALVLPPAGASAARSPVIVYCRGGVGPNAAISLSSPFHLYEMSRYAEAGFFVIAPQYRGADGGEGRDEVGGAEVSDILVLPDVLKAFERADASQLFLVASSRGGMNALAAVRAGFPAKGVVANGVPADWELAFTHNPRLRKVAEDHWPDFKADPTVAITRRSAARWAGELSVPILLQHGGADQIVHPSVVLEFARKLTEANKPYDLVIYAGDDHPIANHFDERVERAISWIRERAPQRLASVVAEDFKLTLPAQLDAGRNRFVFENRGREPHYFRLMRFSEGKGIADFLAWRKSRTPVPAWLVPSGGAGTLAPGERAEYAADLVAGNYVVFCGHPSPDGVQHVDKGMHAVLTVQGEPVKAAITEPDISVELGDSQIKVAPGFHKGAQTAHIRNTGSRTHQALLILLPEGVRAEDELAWFRGGSRGVRPGRPMGGVIELAAGSEAWAGFDLRPGRYLLICAVAGADGKRHFDHGMSHSFVIS
jgi:dienelactone hydrolase